MTAESKFLDSLPQWSGDGRFSLDSISALLDCLGNPQERLRCIHVAGSNGKGSVCSMISSIIGAAGYRSGLTVSPHLENYLERIVVDGLPISEGELGIAMEQVERASKDVGVHPSYFEAIIAAAFVIFASSDLDYVVLETGLGGRLDATNVITRPLVSAITGISLEHTHILGSTIEEIAREKGGIIKCSRPVVLGRMVEQARGVIQTISNDLGSDVYSYGKECDYREGRVYCKSLLGGTISRELGVPGLRGAHQYSNIAVAFQVASLLGIDPDSCIEGIRGVRWPGRLEFGNSTELPVAIDAAHNNEGINALCDFLVEKQYRELTLGFGVLETKSWREMIDKLAPHVSKWHIMQPSSPKAVSPQQVLEYLSGNGISAKAHTELNQFVGSVAGDHKADLRLFTGSIYLIGEVRARLRELGLGFSNLPIWIRNLKKQTVSR